MHQQWYQNTDGTLVCVTTIGKEVVARVYEGDFFGRVVSCTPDGAHKIASLGEAPVIAYAGPRQGIPKEFVGLKVWLPGDSELDGSWSLARQYGQRIRVQDVPSGTSLMGRGAPRLFARLHGGLCVDAKSNTFLGPWRDAVQVHIAQIRENMKRRPKANRTEAMALQVYLAQRTIGWVGQFQLAYALLGLKHAQVVCEADATFRRFSQLRRGEFDRLVASIRAEDLEHSARGAVNV